MVPSAGDRSASARAAAGRTRPVPIRRRSPAASSTAASAHPAARRSVDVGRAGRRPPRPPRSRGRPPGCARRSRRCATTRTTPVPSAPHPGGDRRALGAEPHHVLPREHAPARRARARRPAARGRGRAPARSALPPKAPPLASGRPRLAARLAPRGVGLEVGRLDPRGPQRQVPVAVGQRRAAARRPPWCAGPAPCRPARGPRPAVSPTTQPPPAVGHRDERVGRRGVGGEPAAAERRRRGRPPGPAALDARRGGRRPSRSRAVPSPTAPPPAGRPRLGHRHRGWCATRCSGRGGPAAPRLAAPTSAAASGRRGRRPSSRTMIPGVQKPHWLPPVATSASAHRSRTSAPGRRAVVTARPATRRAGVTQATRGAPSTSTVQQPHWPCGLQPSLTERMPEVVAQHVEQRGAPVGHLPRRRPSTIDDSEVRADGSGGRWLGLHSGQVRFTSDAVRRPDAAQPPRRAARGGRAWPAPACWPPAAARAPAAAAPVGHQRRRRPAHQDTRS